MPMTWHPKGSVSDSESEWVNNGQASNIYAPHLKLYFSQLHFFLFHLCVCLFLSLFLFHSLSVSICLSLSLLFSLVIFLSIYLSIYLSLSLSSNIYAPHLKTDKLHFSTLHFSFPSLPILSLSLSLSVSLSHSPSFSLFVVFKILFFSTITDCLLDWLLSLAWFVFWVFAAASWRF